MPATVPTAEDHAALAARLEDLSERLTAAEERVSALVARLDEPPAAPRTVAGLNLADAHGEPRPWADLLRDHRALFPAASGFPNLRVFFQPGEAPSWDDYKLRTLTADDRPFISVKSFGRGSFTRFLDTMPAHFQDADRPLRFCIHHECEADARKSGRYNLWVESYLDAYDVLLDVLATHPNGRFVEPWKVMLRYTQVHDRNERFPGGAPMNEGSWRDFHGGQSVPLGMDCYFERWEPRFRSAEEFLAPLLEIQEETGLPVSIPEFGGIPRADDRAAAIRDVMRLARERGVLFVNFWCGTGAAGNHHLEQNPADVSAWAEQLAQN